MKRIIGVMLLYITFFICGCSEETINDGNLLTEAELTSLINGNKKFHVLPNYTLSKKEIELFQKQGYVGEYVRVFEVTDTRTGEIRKIYEIGGDGYIYEDDMSSGLSPVNLSEKMAETDIHLNGQYRTTNLVDYNGVRVIDLKAINFFYFQNMNKIAEGLIKAVENYNSLNLGIRFNLKFYTIKTLAESWPLYSPGINVIIHHGTGSQNPGGEAFYPSGGNPGREIRINSGTNNESVEVNEHILSHEIGHTIGMRHTDYFDRAISCGFGYNEGTSGIGAVRIPGTPGTTGVDLLSVFLSCHDKFVSGEFSNYDITALKYLY